MKPGGVIQFFPEIIAFGFIVLLNSICLCVCGASLALSLSGFFIVASMLPPLIGSQQSIRRQTILACVAVGGNFIVWLIATIHSPAISGMQCARCTLILFADALMLVGLVTLLMRLRLPALFAAAITTTFAMAWLTWPIWLVPNLPESHVNAVVAALIRVHPLFAVNGVLANLGDWPHWTIAYRELTTLGQDIPYALPQSIWPSVGLMLLIYCAGIVVAGRWPVRRSGESISRANGSVIGPM